MSHRFLLSLASATLLAISPSFAAKTLAQQGELGRARSVPGGDCSAPTLQTEESRPLGTISVDIHRTDGGRQPRDCSTGLFSTSLYAPADMSKYCSFCDRRVEWAASGLYHQPLYFEEIPLEYYGQSCHPCVQPWLSGAHFFGTFLVVPYKIGLDHPYRRIYELGYYRPGSCAPGVRQRLPLDLCGSALEAGVVLALIFALP